MINAFNAVLIWAKVIKYIGIVPYVSVVVAVLGRVYKHFLSFLGMACVGPKASNHLF